MIKNRIFIDAIEGKNLERPPVWMMRQAGRYLPDFMKLREKYDFFTRCQTPELAAEITVMPIDQVGVDAAILFSDILVIPQAMGIEIEMNPKQGPLILNPIETKKDLEKLLSPDVEESLGYVLDAIDLTREMLAERVPLIGFCGSPWTLLCYMVEGKGSKNFAKAKAFCFKHPELAHELLQKLTDISIKYLKAKAKHGVNAVQIFDSWGGLLGPIDYEEFSFRYINQIVDALESEIPVIVYAKGCSFAYDLMKKSKAKVIGIDWTVSPSVARNAFGNEKVLQGNFDPVRLLSPIPVIEKLTKEMIDDFGVNGYIANLGHGILPNIPVDHAKAFVNSVKNYH